MKVKCDYKGFPARAIALAFLILVAGCTAEQQPLELEAVIKSQAILYPDMEVQDWYKLLHQASMGNRHLGVEDSLIYDYLLGEWERIGASDAEPLIEYISPDSSVVRLNLRPFKAAGGTPDAVFNAMKSTWETFVPSEAQFVTYLEELQQASRRSQLDISGESLTQIIDQKREEGFPAVHHSETYESLYKPAYRVLDRRFIP
ncbi:MAG: hypothetical protein KTR29_19840 [Rhodothermaceae bacterium]|nr:hypothetical protein [Rhodothermaceae bacterium]